MRKYLILTAAAPLALLAACGDNDADETAMTDDTAAADTMANDNAMADANMNAEAGPATALADAGDYSGVYNYTGTDGETAVRINSADSTYEYVGPDNQVQSGTYTTTPDGYRFQIADWYGSPTWFTVSNGQLVRLQEDMELNTENAATVSGERYARANEGDAVFSRFPEPGSPVAPE
ncbi:hypothetical protein GRI62_00350 [Erythrobacter arachoides]|uniref:Lipoprotein n=1 Tax=Aurantiacibacter arachoides TaxID=1850444 RepID=A0A844ZVZ2_9SPHN|nr:hypothetical protein [Aurantiacibacter arachoides]MXO92055.1 hypothetical protein [Aurantiacibacter arachoides]GGD60115.1 hypothetical protein GCM10011411_20350 [Aurantiacibacter arachoides]